MNNQNQLNFFNSEDDFTICGKLKGVSDSEENDNSLNLSSNCSSTTVNFSKLPTSKFFTIRSNRLFKRLCSVPIYSSKKKHLNKVFKQPLTVIKDFRRFGKCKLTVKELKDEDVNKEWEKAFKSLIKSDWEKFRLNVHAHDNYIII